jgi:hypothetical protein
LRSLEITSKPSSFYNRVIKGLYIPYHDNECDRPWGDGIETVVALASFCKGVEYLVCWIAPESIDPRLEEAIAVMRPKRLFATLKNLLGTPMPNFSHPFFDRLSHLQITDSTEWTSWPGIHHLPCLTHVAFDMSGIYFGGVWEVHFEGVQAVRDLLSHRTTLQVCVIRHDFVIEGWPHSPTLDALEFIGDPRLVFVLRRKDVTLDWRCFVEGKPDMWVYAEAAVARHRIGCEVGRDLPIPYEAVDIG